MGERLPQEYIDDKKRKSRNRFFGLLTIIAIALLGILIYELIIFFK